MSDSIPKAQNSKVLLSATDSELAIYNQLNDSKSKNELVELLGLPIQEISVTITMMELKGLVIEELGLISRNPNI
jgi:predicted Rossmann fold nucleotide-binding protein DprA/Smf involved in DNA uptake